MIENIKNRGRRKIVEPIYEWIKRSPKLPYWRQLEKTQFYSADRLYEIQWRRTRKLLRFVYENNDFYRNRFKSVGVHPEDIKTTEDLRVLPLLTKADVRSNTPAMISKGYRIENLQKAKTGGSTGKALELYFTEECSEMRNACARRHDRWSGWEPGEPIAACWGNPYLPVTLKEKLKNWVLQPWIYLDTMAVNDESVRVFVSEWEKVHPTLLFGHAHSLFILANSLKNLGINHLKPKGIISTSMMLLPTERRVIELQFGVKVTDRYGCEEVSLIGCECGCHQGLHLNVEHLHIEFLDEIGLPVKPGEAGSLVITDLMNYAMPLIRYTVEDVGVPSNQNCRCGRGLPLMEQVTGRVADFLLKKDGTKVAGVSLIENTLTRFQGINQMQILQESIDNFTLRIVPAIDFNKETSEHLENYFKGIFGKTIFLKIEFVKVIMPEKSGKYRFTICQADGEKIGLDV